MWMSRNLVVCWAWTYLYNILRDEIIPSQAPLYMTWQKKAHYYTRRDVNTCVKLQTRPTLTTVVKFAFVMRSDSWLNMAGGVLGIATFFNFDTP